MNIFTVWLSHSYVPLRQYIELIALFQLLRLAIAQIVYKYFSFYLYSYNRHSKHAGNLFCYVLQLYIKHTVYHCKCT